MTLGENAANSAVDALESVDVLDGAALLVHASANLPLPRLPLQPSRRVDRTRSGDGAATRVRDAREPRPDRGQAPSDKSMTAQPAK